MDALEARTVALIVDRAFAPSHVFDAKVAVVAYVGRWGIAPWTVGKIACTSTDEHGVDFCSTKVGTVFLTGFEVPEAGEEAADVPWEVGPETLRTPKCDVDIGKVYTDPREVNCS